jgi:chromate transporter
MLKTWRRFLVDVFLCSLSSFGGPEAHYGVFSQILVSKKKYLDEATLSELIGVFALVPGPSSTQTITAIGYLLGGPRLAILTFLVWALPAIVFMTVVGVFFSMFQEQLFFTRLLSILPQIAIGFIVFAGWSLSKKVIKRYADFILFVVMMVLGLLLLPLSIWTVPLLLVVAGVAKLILQPTSNYTQRAKFDIPWIYLMILITLAIGGEVLARWLELPILTALVSFYRYGYSVIGGGQIVIPLMIQDLVQNQGLLSLSTFLSGYAIDQAIPGPLFSFASFVGAQSFASTPQGWWVGILSSFAIFLPGILLVMVVVPIYQSLKSIRWMKTMLAGISIAAASLIVLTGLQQLQTIGFVWFDLLLVFATFLLLLWKKIPTPIVVLGLIAIAYWF